MPNWSQVSGLVERVLWIALSWALGKGYITSADATNLATMMLAVIAAVYAYVVNRNGNLIKQAASVKNPDAPDGKTIVITDPSIAKGLADNVKSSDDAKVVSK